MNDLRKPPGRDATVARAALLRHVEKITLESDGKAIIAAGNWKLLEQSTQGWCRGPVCTILPQAMFFVDLAA
jgi:hypothetical protein